MENYIELGNNVQYEIKGINVILGNLVIVLISDGDVGNIKRDFTDAENTSHITNYIKLGESIIEKEFTGYINLKQIVDHNNGQYDICLGKE